MITSKELLKMKAIIESLKLSNLIIFPIKYFTLILISILWYRRAHYNVYNIYNIYNPVDLLLLNWIFIELLFLIYTRYKYQYFNTKKHGNQLDYKKRRELIKRVLNVAKCPNRLFSSWFLPKQDKPLPLGTTKSWLCWALYYKEINNLDKKERIEFNKLLKEFNLNDGQNNMQDIQYKCMMLNLDDIQYEHKPLSCYMVISILQSLGDIVLKILNFQRYKSPSQGLSYWYHEPKKYSSDKPIVFIHGVGIGLSIYLNYIYKLKLKYSDRKIILLEINYISLNIDQDIIDLNNTVEFINGIMLQHDIKTFNLIAHSYGSILATWIIQYKSNWVNQIQLIDPVCFLIYESHLIYQFLYGQPACFISQLAHYFVSKDIYMAYLLYRHFHWYDNLLFLEDVDVKCNVILSEKDWIVPVDKVIDYIKDTNNDKVQLHILKGFTHGQFLFCSDSLDLLLKEA